MNKNRLRACPLHLRTAMCLLALAGVLFGCSKAGPVQALDDYVARLARTLELERTDLAPATITKPPKTSEMRLDLPAANLDALDFLSLSGCAVQITIGKRNSSLGIFASDSQRLLLELEYLQLAPQCITYMQESGEIALATTLTEAFELKIKQLPGLIFNATLANTEFRQLWKKPTAIDNYPQQTSSAVLSALGAINALAERWLAGDYRAENMEFEILLSEVAKGDGGALLLALSVQEAALEAGNQILRESLAEGPLCSPRYRHRAADVLPKVIRKSFIAAVQPWSAALGRRHHELHPAVQKLEKTLSGVLPGAYLNWKEQREREFLRLVAVPAGHVKLLQQVLAPCSMG